MIVLFVCCDPEEMVPIFVPVDPMEIMIGAGRRSEEQACFILHDLGENEYLSKVSNIETNREECI